MFLITLFAVVIVFAVVPALLMLLLLLLLLLADWSSMGEVKIGCQSASIRPFSKAINGKRVGTKMKISIGGGDRNGLILPKKGN